MDFLVSTGTGAAYFYSFYSFIKDVINNVPSGKDVEYFETSAVLITVILFGKYLEIFARGKTASAIHDLSNQRARFARLIVDPSQKEQFNNSKNDSIDKDVNTSKYSPLDIEAKETKLNKTETDDVIQMNQLGYLVEEKVKNYQNINDVEKDDVVIDFADDEEVIDISLIQKGDILRLVAGESIPADGTLQCEFVGVDESMLTGESRTINKTGGQKVYGGSIVVEGSGLMLVEAVGDNSALGKIMSMVYKKLFI
jgi:cation transport ATPase